MMLNLVKQCSTCKATKTLAEFHRCAQTKDGYKYVCKVCRRDYNKFHPTDSLKVKLSRKRWNQKPTSKLVYKLYQRKYRSNLKNLERERVLDRQRRKHNPGKYRAKDAKRRARKRSAEGEFTENEWHNLCEQYDFACVACGSHNKKLTVDHVIPISRGGTNYINNIQPLCLSCNDKKGVRIIDYK